MRCYYHRNVEGVGVCKSCLKALCPECAVDVGRGLACLGRCETDVADINALSDYAHSTRATTNTVLQETKTQLRSNRKTRVWGAGFVLAIGAICFTWGCYYYAETDEVSTLLPLGAIFAVYGLVDLFRSTRISSP